MQRQVDQNFVTIELVEKVKQLSVDGLVKDAYIKQLEEKIKELESNVEKPEETM